MHQAMRRRVRFICGWIMIVTQLITIGSSVYHPPATIKDTTWPERQSGCSRSLVHQGKSPQGLRYRI